MAGIHWAAPPPATGDSSPAAAAGNEFIDGLTEGPGSREAAEKMRNAGNTLKTLAQNGKFSVNEAGFQAYAKACKFFLDGFDHMYGDLESLTQAAAMGSSDYARKVAKFNTSVANDGTHESMLPNIEMMRDAIKAAFEAMELARKNYRESDNENAISFIELSKKLDSQ
ncbi:hypothetical protein [Amycolatopsis panacis]|uniref:Uncharacterized protein n=1 Tax=Amycolatopsis panacis TaxID=2340917 RepID=A0A419HLM4_9PSEU|nr:hypothetical protein [Amycolatopsis panacis]RJQ76998.1 hypothetical protein D5S19_29825 [Amycolatopsis panacis]